MLINFLPSNTFYIDENPLIINADTQSKIIRIAKLLFSIIIFPIAVYNLSHALAGKILIPISSPSLLPKNLRDDLKKCVKMLADPTLANTNTELQFKRFTVKIDGYRVDGCLISNSSAKNRRWVLRSNGNAEAYESTLAPPSSFIEFLKALEANGIVFNPPGVVNSSGFPNKNITVKAYQTILRLLENELAAEEIIGDSFSFGGGIQGEALRSHHLQEHIKYVFIKDRTFSSLSQAASSIHRFLGYLVKLVGWNMDVTASSKKLQATEIILQTAHVKEDFQEIRDSNNLSSKE